MSQFKLLYETTRISGAVKKIECNITSYLCRVYVLILIKKKRIILNPEKVQVFINCIACQISFCKYFC